MPVIGNTKKVRVPHKSENNHGNGGAKSAAMAIKKRVLGRMTAKKV